MLNQCNYNPIKLISLQNDKPNNSVQINLSASVCHKEARYLSPISVKANYLPFLGKKPEPSFEDFKSRFEKLKISPEEFILSVLMPKNFIGNGNNAFVYGIPSCYDMDNYVFKNQNGTNKPVDNLKKAYNPVYTEHVGNIGQPIAQFGHYEILIKVPGVEGIPSKASIKSDEIKCAQYFKAVKMAAEMPQRGYDNFAKLIVHLNKNNLTLDSDNFGNLLIEEKKAFHPIDMSEFMYENRLSDMVNMLIGNYKDYTDNPTEEFKGYYKEIIRKSLLACNKPEIPSSFCSEKYYWNNALRLLFPSKEDLAETINKLLTAKEQNKPEMFKRYINKLLGTDKVK